MITAMIEDVVGDTAAGSQRSRRQVADDMRGAGEPMVAFSEAMAPRR